MLPAWDEWQAFLRRLAREANINKRRAALVLLTKPIREVDDPRVLRLAFEQVEQLQGERDILITKAVSWLLRSAVKFHPDSVAEFINTHADTLPKIALREVRNKLATGKK
jgi:3-methyladenine DNA glycosylase AlkD